MAERDPAEARLWVMTLVRLSGIGIATAGLYVAGSAAGHMVAVGGGLLLMAKGAAVTLLGPKALHRWWNR
jgi:hypothetical protein